MQNDALFTLCDHPSLFKRLAHEFNEAAGEFCENPAAFIASAIRGENHIDHRRRALLKFGIAIGLVVYSAVFAAMLIFWVMDGRDTPVAEEGPRRWTIVFPGEPPKVEKPKAEDESGGGGGGGNHSLTLPSQGNVPDFSNDPRNAPTTRTQLTPPLFPLQEAVLVDPRFVVKRDEAMPTGLPDGVVGPPSDGPGRDGGIGTNAGGGAGPGDGRGYGHGNKQGTGSGDYKDGGDPRARDFQPQVDSRPVALNRPRPNYTEEARKEKISGIVRVRALVGADGAVKQVRIQSGLPGGLNEEAIRAAFQMRFRPAVKDGQAVNYWVPIDIEFNLR